MTAMITSALLKAVGASSADTATYAPLLEAARVVSGDDFNTISSKAGVAMLVSQLAHESGGFSTLSENLNYSVAALAAIPAHFTGTQALMLGYVKNAKGVTTQNANQPGIANLLYGGRLGNRGVKTSDGWDFRGGGLIQETGLENYTILAKVWNVTPEEAALRVRSPGGAVDSALVFWRSHSLLVPASMGDVTACTLIINGGTNGLADRLSRFKAAMAVLA